MVNVVIGIIKSEDKILLIIYNFGCKLYMYYYF